MSNLDHGSAALLGFLALATMLNTLPKLAGTGPATPVTGWVQVPVVTTAFMVCCRFFLNIVLISARVKKSLPIQPFWPCDLSPVVEGDVANPKNNFLESQPAAMAPSLSANNCIMSMPSTGITFAISDGMPNCGYSALPMALLQAASSAASQVPGTVPIASNIPHIIMFAPV